MSIGTIYLTYNYKYMCKALTFHEIINNQLYMVLIYGGTINFIYWKANNLGLNSRNVPLL